MERDDGQPSTGIQLGNRRLHHLAHRAQFVIDGNADGLEAALGRMLLFPQSGCRHRATDHIYQLQRGFNGFCFPHAADVCRDLGSISFFAVIKQNTAQFFIRPVVDHLAGSQRIGVIHAHIQRRIHHVGKAPASIIQLW